MGERKKTNTAINNLFIITGTNHACPLMGTNKKLIIKGLLICNKHIHSI